MDKKVSKDEEEVEEEEEEEESNSSSLATQSNKKQTETKSKTKSKTKTKSKSKTKSNADSDSDSESEPKPESAAPSAPSLSPSEHYEASLTAIAVHCEKIIEDPSTGVVRSHRQPSALSQVLAFLKDHDVRLRRIAMLSLLKVFNDILPVLSRGNCHLELPHPPRHRRGKGGTAQARGPADPPVRGKPSYRLFRTASTASFSLVLRQNVDQVCPEPRF